MTYVLRKAVQQKLTAFKAGSRVDLPLPALPTTVAAAEFEPKAALEQLRQERLAIRARQFDSCVLDEAGAATFIREIKNDEQPPYDGMEPEAQLNAMLQGWVLILESTPKADGAYPLLYEQYQKTHCIKRGCCNGGRPSGINGHRSAF